MNTVRVRGALSAVLMILVSACGGADDGNSDAEPDAVTPPPAESPEIAALRTTAARFGDVQVALAAGYIPDPTGMCVTAAMEGMDPALGAMGIHYFRPDLLGITGDQPRVAGMGTHTDFAEPGVLIYEPQADGSLALVAIENVVFEAGWTAAGQTAPPSFMGHMYMHMVDDPNTEADEAHGFEPHYELHAWVVRDNPIGMFEPHNPTVTCAHAKPVGG